MKKRSISIFTVLCMMAVMFPAMVSAADYSFLTFDKENGIITDCDESFSGELVIPEEIDGVPVTGIGFRAFEGCTALTGINIPDAVSVIDFGAFEGCTALENINIPDSVTAIGSSAFYGCISLTEINIPDNVTGIGYGAFLDCTALENINISDSVTSIDDRAFYNTAYYNDPNNWDNGILYINNHLIKADSDKLNGGYLIKDGTITIAARAFYKCTALTEITIPDSVIGIGDQAFSSCAALTGINIPDSVTYIGEQVFSYCTALIGIDMSDSITSIGRFMFSDCTALTGITIPGSVEYIDDNAFYGCDNLADVYYRGSEADWQAIDIGSDGNEPLFNAAIHYNHTNTPSISSVTAEPVAGGYSVKVELEDVTSACTVTAVLYDGGGLTNVSAEAAYINTSSVDTTVEGTGGKLKVFIWNSLEGMRPLDVPYEITL